MILFFCFIVLPAIGLFWFLNLIRFLEKLPNGKNTHNQKVMGGFLTVAFIIVLVFCTIGITSY